MGINLDKVRQNLKNLGNSDNTSKYMWKPETGDTVIRIVPYKHNADYPIVEVLFHYNVGNRKVLVSPRTFQHTDPIADFGEQIMREASGEKETWIFGKKLQPKARYYAPVIIRGKESEGVKIWGFPASILEKILKTIADEDYGDVTDPKEGHDLVVSLKDSKESGKNFGEISINFKPKKTPVVTDKEVWAKIRDEQPEILSLFTEPTQDEMSALLKTIVDGVGGESESDDLELETATESRGSKATKSSKVEKASEDFDDMFND